MTVQAAYEVAEGRQDLLKAVLVLQMFQDKLKSEAEVLAEESPSTLKETLDAWDRSSNREMLDRTVWLVGGAVAVERAKEYRLTINDVSMIEAELSKRGLRQQSRDYVTMAAIKNLSLKDVLAMINFNEGVEKAGFPPPFKDEKEFIRFQQDVTMLVRDWEIPADDIRVQGSAIRKMDPKDIDLAVIVSPAEFKRLTQRMLAGTEMDRIKAQIGQTAGKGKIGAYCFDRPHGVESFSTRLFAVMPRIEEHKVKPQLSIIQRGSEMDMQPFMPFGRS